MKSFATVILFMSVAVVQIRMTGLGYNEHLEVNSQPKKPVVNVQDYGVVGDGRVASDCSIASGQALVTCTSAHFTVADVGKSVSMWDAGPSIFKSPTAYVTTLTSRILAYRNGTQVVLANTAGNTANPSSHFAWGTNNYASLNAAREKANTLYPNGYILFFPAGHYLTPVLDFPCGAIGTFGPDPIGRLKLTCTTATSNLTIAGDPAKPSIIENFKEDRGYVTGPPGECSDSYYTCGLIRFGTHSAPNDSTNNQAHWVNGVTIHDLTLIDVKNGNGTFFTEPPVINLAATSNVEIYNLNIQESSYMCIFASGTGEPLNIHDNYLSHCGWGGPAYSSSNAALNVFVPHSKITRNHVYYSGQCFEGIGPFQEFSYNFCEGDDGKGSQPPSSVSPILCIAANSIGPGFWNSLIKGNTCLNYARGGGVGNSLGVMSNIVISDNIFINTPGFTLGDGTEANRGRWVTGEATTNVHGVSVFRNNSFKFDPQFKIRTETGVLLGAGRERWIIDGLAFQMPGPPLIDESNTALHVRGSLPAWQPSTTYTMSIGNGASYVQPPMPNGFYYQAYGSGKGTSGSIQPHWLTIVDSTFSDGTITWKTARKPVHSISNVAISFPNSTSPNSIYTILNTGMLSTDVELSNISSSGGMVTSGTGGDGMIYSATSNWNLAGFPVDFWAQSDDATPTATQSIRINDNSPYSSSSRSGMINNRLPVGQYYRVGDVVSLSAAASGSRKFVFTVAGWRAKTWAALVSYPYNALVQASPDNQHLFAVTDASGCISGDVQPTWQTGLAAITNDVAGRGNCHWKESGHSAQFILRPPN